MYISDINTLINLPAPIAAGDYIIGGYFSEGDGGEGTFIWIVPPIGTPFPNNDGGIIFYNTNDTRGYFKRIYSGPINVRWFGAKGDGVTDDTAAVHAARDSKAFANNGTLYFPIGEYIGAFEFIAEPLGVDPPYFNEVSIIGDGHGSILRSNGTVGYDGLHNLKMRC